MKKLFEGIIKYPTQEEVARAFKHLEEEDLDMRCPDDKHPEIFYTPEMQAAWKSLSIDQRIDLLDTFVGMGIYADEEGIRHFPTIAKTDELADFGKIGKGNECVDFRDSVLCQSFDFETNTFSGEEYRRVMAERFAQLGIDFAR